MNKNSLANEFRPKSFKDFISSQQKGLRPVDVIKNLIQKDLHYKAPVVAFIGGPGKGKTTLAKLYAEATLCENRPAGEYEPCGKCSVCLGENTANIYEYTIQNPTEAREPLKNLINQSYSTPIRVSDRADQLRQFIIIDEFQRASPELASMLLHPLEFSPPTTTWILISMDPESLNSIVREAIESRCVRLSLGKFKSDQIADALVKGYPSLDYDAAMAIADLSEGNMREAWNHLSTFLLVYEPDEITAEDILIAKSGGADPESRQRMWEALEKGEANKVRNFFSNWLTESSDVKFIARLLENDLLDNACSELPDINLILSSLAHWYTSAIPYSLMTVFMSHLGSKVIPFPIDRVTPPSTNPLPTSTEPNTGNLASLSKSLVRMKSAKTGGLPGFFVCETFSEVVAVYAKR